MPTFRGPNSDLFHLAQQIEHEHDDEHEHEHDSPTSESGASPVSGPNHREHHFVAPQRFKRMRLLSGHENQVPAFEEMRFSGDRDFGLSFIH